MNIRGSAGPFISPPIGDHSQQQTKTPSSMPPAPAPGFGRRPLWRPGMLLSKLEQLQQQDPDLFKKIVSQLAESLQKIADKTDNGLGPAAQLAKSFREVAETGDTTSLQHLLHHPGITVHLQQDAGDASPVAEPHFPRFAAHPFATFLFMARGGGIAAAFGTAFRDATQALHSNMPNIADPPVDTGSAFDQATTPGSTDTPSAISTSTASINDNAAAQVTIAAIQNAAVMAIKANS